MTACPDANPAPGGTRFKLYCQLPELEAFREPEIVWISLPPERIAPGPADDRMVVVDPVAKDQPYAYGRAMPPYGGPTHPPVAAGSDGHFDHLEAGTRAFEAAHMYGTVRRVLDIWEGYFGGPIRWHFHPQYARLELIPHVDWENAHSGWGFIEAGYKTNAAGQRQRHCLNFDVLAHELGHSIIFSKIGFPSGSPSAQFRGFHESAGDLVALVSVLHYPSFVRHLLSSTRGNIYTLNELNRIGEVSETEQIRNAGNALRMSQVLDRATLDGKQSYFHRLSQPLTGAFFDVLAAVYHRHLLDAGLISQALHDHAGRAGVETVDEDWIDSQFATAYAGDPQGFVGALEATRDMLGERLAETWSRLSADDLAFSSVAATFLSVDRHRSGSVNQEAIASCFRWREIGFGFS